MNKKENTKTILKLKSFIAGAMLFLLFALSGHFAAANGQAGMWRLEAVQVSDQLGLYADEEIFRADANGGYIDINAYGIYCPGGVEKLRFEWRFEHSVTQISPGRTIGINLRGGQIARSPQCGTATAVNSYITVVGSNGVNSPYSTDFTSRIDRERFAIGNELKIWASQPGPQNGIESIQMKAHTANSNYQYAFFTIDIWTPMSSVSVFRFIYLYKRAA